MRGLSIVLCAYNDADYIRDCLDNLQTIRDRVDFPLEVIIKNQESPKDSSTIIREEYPWVNLIDGPNVGLSVAYNLGWQQAKYDYVLFLGTDAFPSAPGLTSLMHYFDSHEDVGAGTCKLVLPSGDLDMDAHRAFPTPWVSVMRLLGLGKLFPKSVLFNAYFLPRAYMTQIHDIDVLISHFMFVRRSVLEAISGFDEDYFLYGEDVDICYRIKARGWRILYFPNCEVLHLKGASIGVRNTTRKVYKRPLASRVRVRKYSTQAMELFLRKHYLSKYPKIYVYSMIYATRFLSWIRILGEYLRG